MLGTDIAIDLGTAQCKMYRKKKGVVVNEPSIVAVDLLTDRITAVGQQAYEQIGRTASHVAVVGPMRRGVVSDFPMAEYMVRSYLRRIRESRLIMPRAVVTIPCVLTQVEKRSLVDVIRAAGVRKICLIEEAVASAMGAGLDIAQPRGRLVANIGAGCTDIAVITLGGISSCYTLRVGGDDFDDEIIKYVRRKYNLVIGKKTAEQAKIAIGCVYPTEKLLTFRIKGSHARSGLPMWRDLTSDEVLEALLNPALKITRTINNVLESVAPDLLSDILEDGITVTGASAKLYGFDRLISRKTHLPVTVPPSPELCAVNGAGEAIRYVRDLDNGAYGVINPLHKSYEV
ncbi:MAG: rod shape-determining protein [Oscillospiraceae bacterium]|nr:rod shape-determining protein [Oscillospiraceae bacterium]